MIFNKHAHKPKAPPVQAPVKHHHIEVEHSSPNKSPPAPVKHQHHDPTPVKHHYIEVDYKPPPAKHHQTYHDDFDDPLGNFEVDHKKDSLHNNPATKKIEVSKGGGGGDYRPPNKGVPHGVDAIIRAEVKEGTHYIVIEGSHALIQSVMNHLKTTGEWTPLGNNTMVNQKQMALQKLYQYLMRVLHKCKISKVKWNMGIDSSYKQIEEIQIWAQTEKDDH